MLNGIIVKVKPKDRVKLETIVADRNSPQKHVWRARIILLTADGCGTAAIMRGSGTSKTAVWRWQERFMTEGVAGLLRDKTRPGRLAPLGAQTEERVVRATLSGNMLFYNYMLMYAAAIRLRYSKPALARPFKVPGGTVGFAGVLFSFLVAFFRRTSFRLARRLSMSALSRAELLSSAPFRWSCTPCARPTGQRRNSLPSSK